MNRAIIGYVSFLVATGGVGAQAGAAAGFDTQRMVWADQAIESAIEHGQIPGAVLLVGRGDETVYLKAYGCRAVQPQREPMTVDAIFDLASLTKIVACTTSVMLLAERGRLLLDNQVSDVLPAFAANGKDRITIEQLLLHRGGLIADNPLTDYEAGPAAAMEKICALHTVYEPGTAFDYSDVGFIVLGEVVGMVAGKPLDEFARTEIFEPLGMKDTGYRVPESSKPRCAPTEQRSGHWMIGEVHDPRAYALGGVAGHAGLFSTAADLSRWCRMILHGGTLDGKRVLGDATVREMIRCRMLADGSARGYGLDEHTGYSQPRGNFFEPGSTFGHTGFTGTCLWIDPRHDAYFILLTNSVHPNGKGKVLTLRRRVANVVASAIIPAPQERYQPEPVVEPIVPALMRAFDARRPPATMPASAPAVSHEPPNVLCGIDVLKAGGFAELKGKRVAVITNHTGRDREGHSLIELLAHAPDVKLVHILSPEHGLFGKADEKVADTVEERTGLKVFSLYGRTERPTPEMLEGVDTIVFDIQDIGARFYTYPGTMGFAMQAAAQRGLEFMVLDRPNPITGTRVDGPLSDAGPPRLTAFGPLPVVHGMTIGELALLFNHEYGIHCKLNVIEMQGWRRSMWWDETGLTWVNPSPNMRNLTQATIYPGVCLLEACNVSVGRGTDQPFELVGAPWIGGSKWAAALNASNLPGVRFVPVEFAPTASVFATQRCSGVYIVITDRNAFEPVRTGLTMAWELRRLFGDAFRIDSVQNLLSNKRVLAAIKSTDNPAALSALWGSAQSEFRTIRQKCLLYP